MNNNFDYTNIPKNLLYCNRRHLDDFDVEDEHSLNHFIEKRIFERYSHLPNYESFATGLFNCAYYILTMARLERHPERRIGAYWDKARKNSPLYAKDGVMALAIVLQQMWARRWDMPLPDLTPQPWNALYDLIADNLRDNHYDVFKDFFAKTLQDIDADEKKKLDLKDDFTPRKLTRRVLKDAMTHVDWLEYLGDDEEMILEFITAMGKDEDEMMLIAGFLRDELHSAFENGQHHSYCFESIEREIHKLYHADEENAEIDAQIEAELEEEYQIQFELDFYRDDYPRLKAENASMRETIEKLMKNGIASQDDTAKINLRDSEEEADANESVQMHQLLAEKDETIRQLQQEIEDYQARYDPKDVKSKRVCAMTGRQHAILFLAVLAYHNRIPNARTNLSYLLSFIASRNESTMQDYLKSSFSQKECDALASCFDTETPFIANLIRALPEKLKLDKSEKNRTKALKNNNN